LSHLSEYLLLPAACERGLALDCRKGFKMQSAVAKPQISIPTLQAAFDLPSKNAGSSVKHYSLAWYEY